MTNDGNNKAQIKVAAGAVLDHESVAAQYVITLTATDQFGSGTPLSGSAQVTILVNDVPEPPSLKAGQDGAGVFTIAENSPYVESPPPTPEPTNIKTRHSQ